MSTLARKRKGRPAHDMPDNAWMLTFSDLLTLLLTLFVLRLSMSSLSKNPEVAGEIPGDGTAAQTTDPDTEGTHKTPEQSPGALFTGIATRQLTETLGEPLQQQGEKAYFASDFEVERLGDGSVIKLGGSTFQAGSDELSFRAAEAVSALAKGLIGTISRIRIAGHTDDVPINTDRFPSNWELSGARAISVARQMIDAGVDERSISAVGYADTRPLVDNRDEAKKHLNRRVEIYVFPDKSGGPS